MTARMMAASASQVFRMEVASYSSLSLRSQAMALGWNGRSKLLVDMTLPRSGGIYLSSLADYPGGVHLRVSAGTLIGGSYDSPLAIYTRVPLVIENYGQIYGAGGRGGEGGTVVFNINGGPPATALGGESRGGTHLDPETLQIIPAQPSSIGYSTTASGPLFGGQTAPSATGGRSGAGGDWGQHGEDGQQYTITGSYTILESYPAQPGGEPGPCLDGAAFTTWLATGTRLGPII